MLKTTRPPGSIDVKSTAAQLSDYIVEFDNGAEDKGLFVHTGSGMEASSFTIMAFDKAVAYYKRVGAIDEREAEVLMELYSKALERKGNAPGQRMVTGEYDMSSLFEEKPLAYKQLLEDLERARTTDSQAVCESYSCPESFPGEQGSLIKGIFVARQSGSIGNQDAYRLAIECVKHMEKIQDVMLVDSIISLFNEKYISQEEARNLLNEIDLEKLDSDDREKVSNFLAGKKSEKASGSTEPVRYTGYSNTATRRKVWAAIGGTLTAAAALTAILYTGKTPERNPKENLVAAPIAGSANPEEQKPVIIEVPNGKIAEPKAGPALSVKPPARPVEEVIQEPKREPAIQVAPTPKTPEDPTSSTEIPVVYKEGPGGKVKIDDVASRKLWQTTGWTVKVKMSPTGQKSYQLTKGDQTATVPGTSLDAKPGQTTIRLGQ